MKRWLFGLLLAVFLFPVTHVYASTILTDSNGYVTGINDLVVGTTTYNVTFKNEAYQSSLAVPTNSEADSIGNAIAYCTQF